MRKTLLFLLLLAALLTAVLCQAEQAERATYGRVIYPTDAEHIDMGSQHVSDWDGFYHFLRKFPNLKKVDMFATEVYRTKINEIKTEFPDVEFGWTMRISEHTIRTDQTAFSTLHNNKSDPHRSADFSILRYCTRLLALDIGHNLVEDVSFLHYLPQLRVLILACNINLRDISPLRELTELEYLELFKNDIHDISPLAHLTQLRDLNICFNRVQDYEPLKGLHNLQRLWLFNSNNYSDDIPVPYNIVAGLKQALPNCLVDAVSYSTLGGWREHERYDIINKMFDEGYYIPFRFSPPVTELTYLYAGGKTLEAAMPVRDDSAEEEADSFPDTEVFDGFIPAAPMPDIERQEESQDERTFSFN